MPAQPHSIEVIRLQHSLTIAIWEHALAVKQDRGNFAVDFHDSNRLKINNELCDLAERWGK